MISAGKGGIALEGAVAAFAAFDGAFFFDVAFFLVLVRFAMLVLLGIRTHRFKVGGVDKDKGKGWKRDTCGRSSKDHDSLVTRKRFSSPISCALSDLFNPRRPSTVSPLYEALHIHIS